MADDLGARLVQAGLLTREQLSGGLAEAPRHEGALAVSLVERGLSADALAGFFVAAGFGPLLDSEDLAHADPSALKRVPGLMAVELYALPVRDSPAGLVVAMAAPSDRHAVSEIGRAAGSQVLPTVARISELRAALQLAYPSASEPPRRIAPESEPPVLELVHVRKRGRSIPAAGAEGYIGSTRGAERVEARASVGPRLSPDDDDDDAFVPLVRTKAVVSRSKPPAFKKKVITKNFERPSRQKGKPEISVGEEPLWGKGDRRPSRPPVPLTKRKASPEVAAAEEETTESASPAIPSRAQAIAKLKVVKKPVDRSRVGPDSQVVAMEVVDRDAVVAPVLKNVAKKAAPARPPPPRQATPAEPPPPPSAPKSTSIVLKPSSLVPKPGSIRPRAERKASAKPSPTPRAAKKDAPRKPKAPKSIIPPGHDNWEIDITEELPDTKVNPLKLKRLSPDRPSRPPRPAPIGGTLAAMRRCKKRDQVVEMACQGALTVARTAVLLALRKQVLKGWDGAGASLSRDAVRNLWIPTNSPSMFREVVADRVVYHGAPGTTAADGLFRAALGSHGGDVALVPVLVGGKLVGVFAADDLKHGIEGIERVEILARAIGDAFERIIVQRKR